jgi:hypothetical protein
MRRVSSMGLCTEFHVPLNAGRTTFRARDRWKEFDGLHVKQILPQSSLVIRHELFGSLFGRKCDGHEASARPLCRSATLESPRIVTVRSVGNGNAFRRRALLTLFRSYRDVLASAAQFTASGK